MADRTNVNNTIWFDLCLGNVDVDADGESFYKANYTRLSELSLDNITSISEYRELLHKLLDSAIDRIDASQKRDRFD